MDEPIGLVTSIAGSQMTVTAKPETDGAAVGAMVKVQSREREVVGIIVSMCVDPATNNRVYIVDMSGELTQAGDGRSSFGRGVSHYPVLGSAAYRATAEERAVVFAPASKSNLRVGSLSNDETQAAFVGLDELLGKHFAIVGATGSGKSCSTALILLKMLEQQPNAHIVLLDPHNEYACAFGDIADVVTVDNLQLPFWLLDLEEAVRVLARGGSEADQEASAVILKDVITRARRQAAADGVATASISVDTPVPYRVFDLLRFINDAAGRLDRGDSAKLYLRLRTRLESLRDDRRFSFMFSDEPHDSDLLSSIVGRLLRIPVGGKPLTILDLSGVPSEICDVVVSLTSRLIFDFALWCDPQQRPPVLLVCEEAHRYVPEDRSEGFAAASRALTRIAKEGRKYGLSLGLISQRPSELSATALSQCGTIFALRMSSERDQTFVAKAIPDAAQSMLRSLPSLGTQQAIIFGESVPLPMRIRFDDLPAGHRPQSESARFSIAWQTDVAGEEFRDDGVQRWRRQTRSSPSKVELTPLASSW